MEDLAVDPVLGLGVLREANPVPSGLPVLLPTTVDEDPRAAVVATQPAPANLVSALGALNVVVDGPVRVVRRQRSRFVVAPVVVPHGSRGCSVLSGTRGRGGRTAGRAVRGGTRAGAAVGIAAVSDRVPRQLRVLRVDQVDEVTHVVGRSEVIPGIFGPVAVRITVVGAAQAIRNVVVGQDRSVPLRREAVLLQDVGGVVRTVVQFLGESGLGVDFDLFELNVPLVGDGTRSPAEVLGVRHVDDVAGIDERVHEGVLVIPLHKRDFVKDRGIWIGRFVDHDTLWFTVAVVVLREPGPDLLGDRRGRVVLVCDVVVNAVRTSGRRTE